VRVAWTNHIGSTEPAGIYTRTWDGSWSPSSYISNLWPSHTSVSGYYIAWDSGDYIYSNEDGEILFSSGHPNIEQWHDVVLGNETVHLVYIDQDEIFYIAKANWPDLYITNVQLDPPSEVNIESPLQIDALIENKGGAVQNVEVIHYLGDPDADSNGIPDPSAVVIGTDMVNISEDGSITSTIFWVPDSLGTHSIYTWVDPHNQIIESDEDNMLYFSSIYVISRRPAPPSNVRARLYPDNIKDVEIIWNRSLDDGGGENDVGEYLIYRSSTGVNGSFDYITSVWADGSSSYSWLDVDAGEDDLNDYYYLIRPNDWESIGDYGNKVGKIVIPLEENWNVISVPLSQMNNSADCVFQTLENNYTTLQGYHAGRSEPWVHWQEDKPNYFIDEMSIDIESGYYLDMKNPDDLVVAGAVPISVNISINTGWNLVGYPSFTNHIRTDGMNNLIFGSEINAIQWLNSTTGTWHDMDPDDSFEVGRGYWIHAKTDCVWEVPL
jgi:hypothetical protein